MSHNYEIIKQIGEGAFSEVFLAKHKTSDFPVALKKLKTDCLDESDVMQCFNEIILLQKVNSENVICCFGAFREENDFCISLEYADNGDLQNLIEIQRESGRIFAERSIWFYFHQICAGLKDLHAKRILHRGKYLYLKCHQDDAICSNYYLKPANIFITSKGKAKIGDLGLSRIFSMKTQLAKTEVGTEYYLAPERNSGGGYHFRSDIWSLGCILYELCSLRSPFNGEQQNAYALYKRIETCQFPYIPANCYSRQLQYFVSSCVSVKPEKRPTAQAAHNVATLMHKKFETLRAQYKRQFGK